MTLYESLSKPFIIWFFSEPARERSREIQGKLVKHDLTMKMFNFKISKLMQCFDKITDVKITKKCALIKMIIKN